MEGKGRKELIVSTESRLKSFDPESGKPLWDADGVHRYVCPSVVAGGDVVFAIGGGHTSLAVRLGGSGDVTESHGLWRQTKGSNVGSPVYHEGHLYWASDGGGLVCCQNAETGEFVYQERLEPRPGNIWSSPVLADGKLYIVSQHDGHVRRRRPAEVRAAGPQQIRRRRQPHQRLARGARGQMLLRTDKRLYCIGKR